MVTEFKLAIEYPPSITEQDVLKWIKVSVERAPQIRVLASRTSNDPDVLSVYTQRKGEERP